MWRLIAPRLSCGFDEWACLSALFILLGLSASIPLSQRLSDSRYNNIELWEGLSAIARMRPSGMMRWRKGGGDVVVEGEN